MKFISTAMPYRAWYFPKKILLVMKLTIVLIFISLVSVSASSLGQITLHEKNIRLDQVFDKIRKQTGYTFVYESELIKANRISVNLTDASLNVALQAIFRDQSLTFKLVDKNIVVQQLEQSFLDKVKQVFSAPITVQGVVVNDKQPLEGVTVSVKGTAKGTLTNQKGEFVLSDLKDNDVLVFNYIGYEKYELSVKDNKSSNLTVALKLSVSKLDEVQVVAYGQNTNQRLTTGSIARVSAEDIARQPVTNVLQALSGQVPGLLITQASGTPGAGVSVQIRAANSLPSVNGVAAVGSNPLYIIDGVPFLSEPVYTAGGNTVGYLKPSFGNSPLNAINPIDIQDVTILKDADATSIYGSRGANGVILITTKKGKSGKTRADFNYSTGISDIANLHRVKNMTLDQYLEVRKKAFSNANATPTALNAPDLLVWDQTQGTDFQKVLFGKTAHSNDFSSSFSGGNEQTNFLLSGNYHKETTVTPGDFSYHKGSIHFAAEHSSLDRKFTANVSATLVLDKNNNTARQGNSGDVGQVAFTQAPNFPLYNSTGGLYWYDKSLFTLAFNNPLSNLYQDYTAKNNNLIGGIMLKYTPVNGLNIKLNASYNKLVADAKNLRYSQSYNPYGATLPSASSMQNTAETWNVEPQIDYSLKIGQGNLNVLAGATFQDNKYDQPFYIIGSDYSSDALLGSFSNAGSVLTWNFNSEYKYQSVFGRLSYNWLNKYLLNVNYRYDGSSKFGANKRFGTFGSVGGAWILSEENFIKKSLPLVSFAKVRASYGTAGNDQIPDYLYFDTYQTTYYGYAGTKGLVPAKLANPDLEWEITRKFEAALDLGFLKDRILLSGAWFRNRTNNSLVSNTLSVVSGFDAIYGNLPATKQQQGFEFTLTTQNIKSKDFSWTTNFNISFAQSKLLRFENIANTAYADVMEVGQSLSTIYGYRYTGLSADKNLPTFLDANHNGSVSLFEPGLASNGVGDFVALGKTDPDYFGGMNNSLRYKNLQMDFLFQFTGKSTRYGIEYYTGINAPGYNAVNMSSYTYDLFKATDGAIASRASGAGINGTPADSYYKYTLSDAVLSNGAYLRLKNVALSYVLDNRFLKNLKLSSARIFLQGQNLMTVTKFKGYDPETPANNTPPLKTIIAGVNFSF
jgi:TonB-linked SusC/RagA family outer membrane protein